MLQAQGVRHIAAIRDKAMAEEYVELSHSPHQPVRIAVMQSLNLACPDSRFKILRSVMDKEENPDVRRQAIEQLSTLGGNEAKELLQNLSSSSALKSGESSLVNDAQKIAATAQKKNNFAVQCSHV